MFGNAAWSVCSMYLMILVAQKKYCCRSEQWPASSYVQLLGYWKMYRKWISDSASAVFMTGMFLKEFSLNVIILLLPLKSDWIFHLNEITFPFLVFTVQKCSSIYHNIQSLGNLMTCKYRRVFVLFILFTYLFFLSEQLLFTIHLPPKKQHVWVPQQV